MHRSESSHCPADYRAYLLRLWREREDGPWRISLQASNEQTRLGFADLESLVEYLSTMIGESGMPDGHAATQTAWDQSSQRE